MKKGDIYILKNRNILIITKVKRSGEYTGQILNPYEWLNYKYVSGKIENTKEYIHKRIEEA